MESKTLVHCMLQPVYTLNHIYILISLNFPVIPNCDILAKVSPFRHISVYVIAVIVC